MPKILEVEKLGVALGRRFLVGDLSFTLRRGASLGILGESGSGKSLSIKAITGLLPPYFQVRGRADFQGQDLLTLPAGRRRALRGRRIGYICQNPMTAFDPLASIGAQMVETYKAHFALPRAEALSRARAALEKMLIRDPERVTGQYPHELSGGMLQRVMIGLTLTLEPEFIIADEPTTALDVITQAEIMNIFVNLKKELHTTMIFVSHDLGVIAKIADDILVMNDGRAMEYGPMEEIFDAPKSRHTRDLFDSRLSLMKRFHQEVGARVRPCF